MRIRILIHIFLVTCTTYVMGQGNSNVIQFTGLVVGGDSLFGIPGVHVYVPKAGRGTTTNYYGYFSMPTVVGDSVVISAIGFKVKSYIIPSSEKRSVSVIIELKEDTTLLPVLEVFPYPTEELFKQAFLALKLPDDPYQDYMRGGLTDNVMSRILYNSKMDSHNNYLYYMQTETRRRETGGMAPGTADFRLLDPFAWRRVIKEVRNRRKARKREE